LIKSTNLIQTRNTFNIVWNKWAILWIINDKSKWILQKIKIPSNIKTCSKNLSNNGIYCYTTNWNIYNISKYGLQSVSNSKKWWNNNVLSLWTYWNNKLYTLNNNKTIQRYVLKWKNKFWTPTTYNFSKKADKTLINGIYSWSNFVIDGTFVIWTKQWLTQAWRKSPTSTDITIRKIPWWKKWTINENDFKWNVKVISNISSKYIYLYDYNTQSLVIYLTSPYKTNSANTYSYNLIYKFKVKFDITNETVKDITVKENSSTKKAYAYILTDKKIYKIDLTQLSE